MHKTDNYFFIPIIIFLIVITFGCTQTTQNNPPAHIDTNIILDTNQTVVQNETLPNDTNQQNYEDQKPEKICTANYQFFDYYADNPLDAKLSAVKTGDFNSNGLCKNSFCNSYLNEKIDINENSINIDITEYFDFNLGIQEKYGQGWGIPQNATNIEITFNKKPISIRQTGSSQDDFNIDIPLITTSKAIYTTKYVYPNIIPGRNTFNIKYSYIPEKFCANKICIYPIEIFAYPNEIVELDTKAYGKIMNSYKKVFIGPKQQLFAITSEPTFSAGPFEIAESQRNYYISNKDRIDRVGNNMDFIGNAISQRPQDKIFIFFTNQIHTSTSFTNTANKLIIIQGDYFDDYFEEVLMHESVHQTMTNPYMPQWLDEGIANFVAAKYIKRNLLQENNKGYIISDNNINYYLSDITANSYDYASGIVSTLYEKYGCQKVWNFLKALDSLDGSYDLEKIRVESAAAKYFRNMTYENLIDGNI